MIKQIVIWRLKESANGKSKADNACLIKEKLEGLRGKIPGMLSVEVGVDFSDTGCSGDVVLYSEFESREALAAHHEHPEYQAVMPFVQGLRVERRTVAYEAS